MGACQGLSATHINENKGSIKGENDEITDINQIKVNQRNFILQKNEKFRDNYTIGQSLGQGAFGEVRKCQHKKLKSIRAVKILRKDALDEKEVERFIHEIEILKKLDHPNILRLFEFYEDNKRYYLVTELCTGGELFDEITSRSQFSEQDAAKIIQQVLSAISYCHANQIVHRDLKPENLLLDSKNDNTIKVIDFGTSQRFDPSKKMKQTFGTAYYIAPEVLTSEYNEKCDVWSIGVILYILLSGRPPFDGKDDREIVRKVRIGHYDINTPEFKYVSREAIDLLKKMLTYDPERRISAEESLKHAWITKKAHEDIDNEATLMALTNLKNFNIEKKLQQAAISFIVSQLAQKEDLAELQRAFKALDKNSDGKLSREELIEGYQRIYGEMAEDEVDKILKRVDADGSGQIDYSEWVVATINKEKYLSTEKLQAAFSLFDKDGSGSISSMEVKELLCKDQNIDEKVWEEVIKEVDNDGNGEIDFEEFAAMMQKMLSS